VGGAVTAKPQRSAHVGKYETLPASSACAVGELIAAAIGQALCRDQDPDAHADSDTGLSGL